MAWCRYRNLENFYHSLATTAGAGVPLRRSLELATVNPPLRAATAQLVNEVDRGTALAEAWRATGAFDQFDVALIAAGEQSGTLAASLHELADHYRFQAELRARFLWGLAFPVLILLAALGAINLSTLYFDGVVPFLKTVTRSLALIGGALLAAWLILSFLYRTIHGMARVTFHTPFLGGLIRARNRHRFYYLLRQFYRAGFNFRQVGKALNQSFEGAYLRDEMAGLKARLDRDLPLTKSVAASTFIPEEEKQLLAGAEEAGELDETTGRLADRYRKETEAATVRLPRLIGVLAYLAVVIVVIQQLTHLWAKYWSALDQVANTLPGG